MYRSIVRKLHGAYPSNLAGPGYEPYPEVGCPKVDGNGTISRSGPVIGCHMKPLISDIPAWVISILTGPGKHLRKIFSPIRASLPGRLVIPHFNMSGKSVLFNTYSLMQGSLFLRTDPISRRN